ncbi:immunity protein YezG family protein [Paenibacillus macerans]|uniref:immunity protein YezG family protein n=1 Tax=Paenibacillus macerans TaxID=44252 RepID=UPI00203E43C6|nr:immunity protein YezG family protein [Paenibacillus macerans]MCM3702387.1 antitoxin YezG family protein [Paenibacillus macerans]
MEEKLNALYKEIAETVDNMIPVEWNKFYFYAQVSESGGGTYFFYSPISDPVKFEYSLKIPINYEINEKEFDAGKGKLLSLAEEMKSIFAEYEQDLWYSFTLSLERTGKLKVHFDYTNWFDTNYTFNNQMIIWKYKYLNEVPIIDKHKEIIKKYLLEYPDNPI